MFLEKPKVDILLIFNESKLPKEIALDLLMRTTLSLEKTVKICRMFILKLLYKNFKVLSPPWKSQFGSNMSYFIGVALHEDDAELQRADPIQKKILALY